MAPTYPDFSRMHPPLDVPPYAKDDNFLSPYSGENPEKFTFPKDLPVRTRVPAHLVDEAYIRKYNRAVHLMKELPSDDPRNFTQQANVHCAYCNKCYYMDKTNKPFTVHGGWFFLPWHRWFLYFYERILMKLLEDNTFALPYWNWDFEDGMTIPPMYLDEKLSLFDPIRNPCRGPDSIVDLCFPSGKVPASYEEQRDRNYRLMHKQVVSLARTTRAFHGAPRRSSGPDSGCTCGAGTLETSPHNNLHNWMGNEVTGKCPCPTKTCYGEDMGNFYSAGRDPIFYAHHANLDRIWTIWRRLPGRKDYDDTDLLDTRFFFYDENARLVSVRAGDAFDNRKLRYQYQHSPKPWLHRQPDPQQQFNTRAIDIPLRPPHDMAFLHPVKANLSWPTEWSLQLVEGKDILLLVEGIRVPRNLAVKFDIFINLDYHSLLTPYVDSVPKEFAGTYMALPRGARDDEDGGCGQSSLYVGISEVLSDLNVSEGENMVVTLVPKLKPEDLAQILDDPIRISSIKLLEYTGESV